jgi:hypothetical protein
MNHDGYLRLASGGMKRSNQTFHLHLLGGTGDGRSSGTFHSFVANGVSEIIDLIAITIGIAEHIS